MKFLLPIALLALGAAAADSEPKSDCAAEDIVEACLTSQQAKFDDCGEADYNCKCAAQEAIATCFNNCPDDTRAGDAQGQVQIQCSNASQYGSKSAAPTKSSSSKTDSASEPSATSDSDSDSGSGSDSESGDDSSSAGESQDGAAGGLVLDMGELLLGVAGVMAVVV